MHSLQSHVIKRVHFLMDERAEFFRQCRVAHARTMPRLRCDSSRAFSLWMSTVAVTRAFFRGARSAFP